MLVLSHKYFVDGKPPLRCVKMFSGRKQVVLETVLTIICVVVLPCALIALFMPCYRYQVNSSLDKKLGNDLYYVDGSFCDVACKVEQMSHQIGLTIIMPAFNEEMRLPSTMNVTLDHMQTYSEATGLTYEILVVDDYSTDKTSDLVLGYSRAEMMKRHNTLIANEEEMNDVSCSSSNDDSCDTTTAADTTKGGDVRLLQLRRNRGKGGAIRRGVLASRGQYILFADADGATDITYVDNLLSKL